jgi:hypothetical protein
MAETSDSMERIERAWWQLLPSCLQGTAMTLPHRILLPSSLLCHHIEVRSGTKADGTVATELHQRQSQGLEKANECT